MELDNLKTSLQSFLAWRKAQDYRATVKTRAAMLAYCGKHWTIAKDHKRAYFHTVEDFGSPVWDSANDVRGNNSTGYYADSFCDNVIRWAVVKIAPANKKQGREALYAPITYATDCEGVTLHLDCAGSEDDARRWGEQAAEREAEECREGDAQFQAERQIAEAREEIATARQQFKTLHAELVGLELPANVCATIRAKLASLREEVRDQVKRIRNLENNFWLAVERY